MQDTPAPSATGARTASAHRPRILVITPCYLPGYKAGGPIRTISNMIEWLGDEIHFDLLTTDRDLGDTQPYPSVVYGTWQAVGKAWVRYLHTSDMGLHSWRRILNDLDIDLLYLNGFFNTLTIKTLALRRAGLIPRHPVILAPRGEFSPGALALKRLKKQSYIRAASAINLCAGVSWQASSDQEVAHIRSSGVLHRSERDAPIVTAPNFPGKTTPNRGNLQKKHKIPGSAHIIFLSRISRKKNLAFAIKALSGVQGQVDFDIYGPIEDSMYWRECEGLIAQLPANIQVRYRGLVPPEQISDTFSQYHLFLFPTLGENFGHVILESFCAGCPVLISDQTPWHQLAAHGAGWDIPLERVRDFVTRVEQVVTMDAASFRSLAERAYTFGEAFVSNPAVRERNRQMFLQAMGNNNKNSH